jgi:hypothetical protein
VDLRHPPHGAADGVPLDGDANRRARSNDAERGTDYARAAWEATLACAARTT